MIKFEIIATTILMFLLIELMGCKDETTTGPEKNDPITERTNIQAGEVSGTWTLAKSPFQINGEITVPDGKTLIIEPGVVVNFAGHSKLHIKGRLLAVGLKQDTILFTALNKSIGWNGIKLVDIASSNDSTIFEYCIFQHGMANSGTGILNRSGGAINSNLNKLRISNCLFQNNLTAGSRSEAAGGALAIWGGGDPIIEYCEFTKNESGYGAAMVVDGNSTDALIRNNHFHENNGHGTINIGNGASPIFVNNLIEHNISDGHGNIHFAATGGKAVMINNTIVNNTCGGQGGAVFVNHELAPLFINTIIYGNQPAQVHLLTSSGLDFLNCLIEGGEEVFTGALFTGKCQNCIDSDPLFLSSDDCHLHDSSPCIGAGVNSVKVNETWYYAPSADIEGNPRPNPAGSDPDIGAFERE